MFTPSAPHSEPAAEVWRVLCSSGSRALPCWGPAARCVRFRVWVLWLGEPGTLAKSVRRGNRIRKTGCSRGIRTADLASGPQLFNASDSNVEACNRNKPGCLAVVTSPRSEDMGLELLVELAPPRGSSTYRLNLTPPGVFLLHAPKTASVPSPNPAQLAESWPFSTPQRQALHHASNPKPPGLHGGYAAVLTRVIHGRPYS